MKALLTILFLVLLLVTGLSAFQHLHAQAAGRISYEATRRIDPSQLRVVINGQELRPGSPDFPADIPDVRTFAQTLSFAGDYAKETQEGGGMMIRTTVDGPGGPGGPGGGRAPQTTNLGRPFEETTYLNLKDRTAATVLAVKKDDKTTEYRADAPIAKTEGWQLTEQTRKIAGYTCRKATVPFRKETYTVWVTTELPFTYSPIRELTPDKGVVLAVEGANEQFRASKVDLKAAVAEAEVRPGAQAQKVSPEELKDLRDKARADFRQRAMESFGGRN
ncbi:GLPGLI family protein [Hymenobacter jeollabukensis]|uniref:GLPGLI family protein n=1 Tax=Hymenobacter jeollabukensis TaxID=2025313 RepID=A0A5R8WMR1_9BACT|nr:GLPGLI family protein [Hymenobacter jeollabukensis]TLM90994.1 GLPGLI family protein [Hymenobacter jeollabukensis]